MRNVLSLSGQHSIASKKTRKLHLLKRPKLPTLLTKSHTKRPYGTTTTSNCNDINWAIWANFTGSAATGTITNDSGKLINISMNSNFDFGSTSNIFGYDKFSGYPAVIPNSTVPETTWAVGTGGVTTMCFSQTVTNPVLLLSSLGNGGVSSRLDFSIPYVLLYDGGGMTYNSDTALTGAEGYAIIMFPGDFTCVTIDSSTPEYYTNITWGIRPPPFPVNFAEKGTCYTDTLTASGGVTYSWNGGDTPNKATNVFHESGTYIVTVTNADNCTTAASKTITINQAPNPVITGNTTGCDSVKLTASGGASYLWNGGKDPGSATNTFTASGTYTVVVTSGNGCTASASETVVVKPPPVPVIAGNATGCDSVTLTASGGVSYLWNGGKTPDKAINIFTASGTYTVVATNANGCTASASKTVVVNPLPIPVITGNTTACDSIILTASGGVSYLWSGGKTPDKATNTFTASGTYTVVATNINGCEASASKTIVVMPAPVPVIAGNATGCDSVTLTVSGGVSYLWNGGKTPDKATNTFTSSGTYNVVAANTNGCTASASKTVVVNPVPVPVITGNTTACDSVTLTASGGVSYLWNGGKTPDKATNTFTASGTYTVTVSSANGCTATTSASVTINPDVTPSVSITASTGNEICAGTPVVFTATVLNGGQSPAYQWFKNNILASTDASYQDDSLADNDVITCRLTSNALCATPATVTSNPITMTVNTLPAITFNQNLTITGADPIYLSPVITGNIASYTWSPANGLSSTIIANPVANPQFTTTYMLTVTTDKGCVATTNVKVIVKKNIIIPNTFTPNGDGINDTWDIAYLIDYQYANINVYNRYGGLVFHSVGYNKPWDGTYNGKPLPIGTYYYVIDLKDKRFGLKSGWVAILR